MTDYQKDELQQVAQHLANCYLDAILREEYALANVIHGLLVNLVREYKKIKGEDN